MRNIPEQCKSSAPVHETSDEQSIQIEFLGAKVLVTMPKDVLNLFLRRSSAILPASISPTKNQNSDNYDVHISSKFGKPMLTVQDGHVHISSRANGNQFATDIMLATSKFLEVSLNKKGVFSLHSAAIAYKDEGTIILGQQGAGKTTVAITSCFMNNEIKLISGSRVFVQGEKIVGGIAGLDVRKGSILIDLAQNLRSSGNLLSQSLNNKDIWEERVILKPEEQSIKLNNKYPIKVRNFVLVKRLPKSLSVVGKEVDRDSFLSRVYDSLFAFSDQIPWYVLGNKIPYPDIFGDKIRRRRIAAGGKLLGSKPYTYLEGTLEDISTYLVNNLKRK